MDLSLIDLIIIILIGSITGLIGSQSFIKMINDFDYDQNTFSELLPLDKMMVVIFGTMLVGVGGGLGFGLVLLIHYYGVFALLLPVIPLLTLGTFTLGYKIQSRCQLLFQSLKRKETLKVDNQIEQSDRALLQLRQINSELDKIIFGELK